MIGISVCGTEVGRIDESNVGECDSLFEFMCGEIDDVDGTTLGFEDISKEGTLVAGIAVKG